MPACEYLVGDPNSCYTDVGLGNWLVFVFFIQNDVNAMGQ